MKKIAGLLLFLFLGKVASSQIMIALLFGDKLNKGKMEFGITVNPCFTNISDLDGNLRPGLNLGIFLNFNMSEKFIIHVDGIAKGSYGAKNLAPYPIGNDTLDKMFEGGKVERVIKAFSLPILARYRVARTFFLDAGIQANWMLKAKDVFNTEVDDQDLDYTIHVSGDVTKLDFGLAAGFHFKLKDDRRSMGLGFRYYQGLTDIIKSRGGNQVNSAMSIVVTIPVGTGKAAAAQNGQSSSK